MIERPWVWSSDEGWWWGNPDLASFEGENAGPFATFLEAVASYRAAWTPREVPSPDNVSLPGMSTASLANPI